MPPTPSSTIAVYVPAVAAPAMGRAASRPRALKLLKIALPVGPRMISRGAKASSTVSPTVQKAPLPAARSNVKLSMSPGAMRPRLRPLVSVPPSSPGEMVGTGAPAP